MTTKDNPSSVSLRYIGSAVVARSIGEVTWEPENGHVAAVPVELAADLLTGRESGEWELAERPAVKVQKELAELMGLAPAELIVVAGEEPEGKENNV